MAAMLEIKDLHVYYGAIHAIKGISLTVNEGEIVTLIGANGAGKSTTLRTVSGLLTPRGGSVSFDPNLRRELLGAPGLHEALQQTLAATDIFLPSGDELYLFTTAQNEADAIAELLARGIKEILLKRGEQGASHYSADGRLDAAPIAVREDDPTGAGDSFGGAYIALRLNGHDAASALRYANAAGARAVTRIGPMEGTSTLAELDALLIAHKNN